MSFQFNLSPTEKAGSRFLEDVRTALVSAFMDRKATCGLRQSHIAEQLDVHRSVINRELNGDKNITVMRVGEIAEAMGFYPSVIFSPKEEIDGANAKREFSLTISSFKPEASTEAVVISASGAFQSFKVTNSATGSQYIYPHSQAHAAE